MQIKKTIAIQVDDPVFLAEYEKRQKESGLKVKDYLLGLIKADIQSRSITQTEAPGPEAAPDNQPEQTQAEQAAVPMTAASPKADYTELICEHIENQWNNGYITEADKEVLLADIVSLRTQMQAIAGEHAEGLPLDVETDAIDKLLHDTIAAHTSVQRNQDSGWPDASQAPDDRQQEAASAPSAPVYSGEITNLFVKITKEQRAAIDARKAETGETTNNLLNRLIGDFLKDIRGGNTPEGFYDTYDHFDSIAKSCDTTCSAKIPAEMNRELAEYLESTGRSRNVLMATLVHIDLYSQEMSEEQGQGMTL